MRKNPSKPPMGNDGNVSLVSGECRPTSHSTQPPSTIQQYCRSHDRQPSYPRHVTQPVDGTTSATWYIARGLPAQIPTADVGELAVRSQHGRIRADVARVTAERSKVRVAFDVTVGKLLSALSQGGRGGKGEQERKRELTRGCPDKKCSDCRRSGSPPGPVRARRTQ